MNLGGRPPIFKDVDEVATLMEGYFQQFEGESPPKKEKAPNLFGLCRYLSISYDAFIDYENETHVEGLSAPFKDARLRCLEYAGENAFTRTAGAVFTMVNLTKKFKEPWKNAQAQEVDNKHSGSVDIRLTKHDENL